MGRKGLIEKVTFQQWPEGSGRAALELFSRRASKARGTASARILRCEESWCIRGIKDIAIVSAAKWTQGGVIADEVKGGN